MSIFVPNWVERLAPGLRFIRADQAPELINLWHLSRTSLAGKTDEKGNYLSSNRHARMVETAQLFHQEHPEVSETAVYKDLDYLLADQEP